MVGAREVVFPVCDGSGSYTWRPKFHVGIRLPIFFQPPLIFKFQFQEDLDFFYKMSDLLELSDRSEYVEVMPQDQFQEASGATILNILRTRHILVTGGPKPAYGFDKAGLRNLAPFSKEITVHGEHSIRFPIMTRTLTLYKNASLIRPFNRIG